MTTQSKSRKTKDECQCRMLERMSQEPGSSVTYLPELNEYRVDKSWVMRFCPGCGKPLPPSRRASRFAHVSNRESSRIMKLFRGITTEQEVLARFGPPDAEDYPGVMVSSLEDDELPQRGEVFKTLEYRELSDVANIIFRIGDNGQARGTWPAKHCGEPPIKDDTAPSS